MLNKVPEVTVYFWVIKILCTTVGETAADYLNENLGFGLTNTTLVMGAALVVVLVVQFRARAYVPGVYWLAVVLISVVGTLITDNLTDNLGVPLRTTTDGLRGRSSRSRSRSGTPASGRCRSTRSSPPAARPSTGWRCSSPSPSAPPPATWSPSSSTSATGSSALLFAGADRRRRRRPLALRADAVLALLARLHPHPPARRVDRRLPVSARATAGSASAPSAPASLFLGTILAAGHLPLTVTGRGRRWNRRQDQARGASIGRRPSGANADRRRASLPDRAGPDRGRPGSGLLAGVTMLNGAVEAPGYWSSRTTRSSGTRWCAVYGSADFR